MKSFQIFSKGLLLFLATMLLLELGLRLIGFVILRIHHDPILSNFKGHTLLFLGDSHTFGVGTSKEYSYPSQLEKLLKFNNPNQNFKTINRGVPGLSTKGQYEVLEKFLRENPKPEIIVWLTGRNNSYEFGHWRNTTFLEKSLYHVGRLRSVRFFQETSRRLLQLTPFSTHKDLSIKPLEDYLVHYFERVRRLCEINQIKLIFASYYSSPNFIIQEYTKRKRLLYFDLSRNFESLFRENPKESFISPDQSHMNAKGYQFYAEKMYEKIYQHQSKLNLKLNPLQKQISIDHFYKNENAIVKNLQEQEKRIQEAKDSNQYAFELAHLGHIYTEIGEIERAREYYLMGLEVSNYSDNNTLVTPLINLTEQYESFEKAIAVCDMILEKNPKNKTAKWHKKELTRKKNERVLNV